MKQSRNKAILAAINKVGSARKLSSVSGVTETTISKARAGDIELTAPTARKLSNAVGGSIRPECFIFTELFADN